MILLADELTTVSQQSTVPSVHSQRPCLRPVVGEGRLKGIGERQSEIAVHASACNGSSHDLGGVIGSVHPRTAHDVGRSPRVGGGGGGPTKTCSTLIGKLVVSEDKVDERWTWKKVHAEYMRWLMRGGQRVHPREPLLERPRSALLACSPVQPGWGEQ